MRSVPTWRSPARLQETLEQISAVNLELLSRRELD